MEIGVISGVWAYIFCVHLVAPTQLFDWWPSVARLIVTGRSGITKLSEISILQLKILKALFMCPICHAGQVAFWAYIFLSLDYSIAKHFITFLSSILTTLILIRYVGDE